MQRKLIPLLTIIILFSLLVVPMGTSRALPPLTISGIFNVRWGDGPSGSITIYQMIADNHQIIPLHLDDATMESAGGILALNKQHITVTGIWAASGQTPKADPVFDVDTITLTSLSKNNRPNSISAAVGGSQPWITIMCKFQDYPADEPATLSYFKNMYASTYPGLDHYWQEVSYKAVNVIGSTAVGWYVLPHDRSYYMAQSNENLLNSLASDCITQADNDVYFPNFKGINLMFNYELDGFAYGGLNYFYLDGVYGGWSTTWEPPWGYSNSAVMAHEMGHGFGLPHSSGNYGATYDNQWDVMSDTWSNCSRLSDPTYHCLGQHTIMYHKDILGWIPPDLKYTLNYSKVEASPAIVSTVFNSGAYLMAEIPILGSASNFYTLETRYNNFGYDTKLPGQGIIIHEVDITRTIPAHVIDSDNNGDTGDAGAIWTVGETFSDAINNIHITVLGATTNGYRVQIQNGAQIATIEIDNSAQSLVFADVFLNYWAKNYIERLYIAGITGGCTTSSPLNYCPNSTVTRAQMAVFLLKGMHGSSFAPPAAGGSTGFGDVPTNYWAAAWVKQLAAENITNGCGGGNYCPDAPVTRAQMAVFLLKAKNGSSYTPPAVGGSTSFGDVPTNYWSAPFIKQLVADGITSGCGGGNYCPGNDVTRAQMAVFLVKTFNLP